MSAPAPAPAPAAASAATTGAPLPTPTFGAGGSFTISCSSHIAAAPRDCLDVVVAASEYLSWNRFCRKCTIDAQPTTSSSSDPSSDPTRLRLGTHFTFAVHLDPSAPDGAAPDQAVALEVSVLEPIDDEPAVEDGGGERRRKGWRIAWKPRNSMLMPAWLLRSERVQEFVEVEGEGGTETEYRCWETFYGVLAPVVRMAAAKQVEKGFEAWSEGLKGRVERGGQ